MRVGIVVGTNRTGALSHKLGKQLESIYRERCDELDLIDLAELDGDFIKGDAYRKPTAAVSTLVQRFMACDAIVFVVPEYNGSYPGALKLYIDMFPYPQGFETRPCAYVGLAAGEFRALRAVEHLQQVAGYRNAHNYSRRVFIGQSFKQFDENGALQDEELRSRLAGQADGFLAFATAVASDGGPAKNSE
jgi:chromate reductase